MIEAEELYEAHRVSSEVYLGEFMVPWTQLSWPQRDMWQAKADELNEARYAEKVTQKL